MILQTFLVSENDSNPMELIQMNKRDLSRLHWKNICDFTNFVEVSEKDSNPIQMNERDALSSQIYS